ncbi:MAG: serine/threonine-protein kinase [Gemmatales bacterium]
MHEGVDIPSPASPAQRDSAPKIPSYELKSNPLSPDFADFARRVNQLADFFRGQGGTSYQIDHYEVFELIGEGGQGIVFRARDTILQRDIALKIPHIQKLADSKVVKRLVREAQSLSQLEHPHILPIYGGGEVNGLPYLVCGYCPGGILTQWLKDHGPTVAPRTAVSWVSQLALGVQHAHEHGIVHRDIKPNNVFLYQQATASPDDLGLTLKLGDFGLAKIMDAAIGDESWTLTQDRLGTPGYMAPEQMTGQHHLLGPATDVYSLGVLLFELLTGTVPFTKATAAWQGIGELPSVRKLCPAVSPQLEAICHKCLAVDPTKRYASVAALHHDLQCVLKGERASVQPATVWSSSLRFLTQMKMQTVLVAGVIALLSTFIFLSKDVPPVAPTPPAATAPSAETSLLKIKADCNEVWAISFTPDGKYLVAAGDTGKLDGSIPVIEHVTIFDVAARQKLSSFASSHIAMIKNIAVLDKGEKLLTSSYDGTVQEWNLKTGEALYPKPIIELPQVMHEGVLQNQSIFAMTVTRDEQWIAISTRDYDSNPTMIVIHHRPTGRQMQLFNAHHCKITQLIFPEASDPTHILFTTTMHDELFRWDFKDTKAHPIGKVERAIQHVAFSPHADQIAFAMLNNDIKICKWPSLQHLTLLKGHQNDIRKIIYSPDNQWLASADISGTVIWWDITRKSNNRQGTYDRHEQIDALAFSPDSTQLAIGRKDGIVEAFPCSSIPR